ncbi:hypothetical protein [Rhodococcus sp. HNM0569]|uniref:hypothetical protein n=1 Tax=Rhodococcus sp. HNM0569 TaxID=2716340 RepID=UPI00146BEB0C|nr:hypothetical protein [Rhodococcus sp. HNM0569]NLU81344.1 hypothetical protein [Rhodococcus sp. HNM0569]
MPKPMLTKAAGIVFGAAAASAVLASPAHADDAAGPVHFSSGNFQRAIDDNGAVGCDVDGGEYMTVDINGTDVAVPFRVNQIVADVDWAPAHPGFAPGAYTLEGGNPDISDVGYPVGDGATSGSEVSHAGTRCWTGFHGSFQCETDAGRGFFHYIGIQAH